MTMFIFKYGVLIHCLAHLEFTETHPNVITALLHPCWKIPPSPSPVTILCCVIGVSKTHLVRVIGVCV